MLLELLRSLNPAQLTAVQHPPEIPLQILAGPGSGKTKVLTSRIAYLILSHNHSPSSICAVTFTNKAANEMRERLTGLIGKNKTDEVRMGTFHALCALFLRKYAAVVGLEANFTVCDADESKSIIAKLLKPYKETLAANDVSLKEHTVLSLISKAKAKGHTAEDLIANINNQQKRSGHPSIDIEIIVAEIYGEYERTLRRSNCLDFDDLLVFGVRLFARHRKSVEWCKHVFVDEFQDTNTTQYELMRHMVAANRCVTVVGDPDQSIYGWRSAEIENLSKMRNDFPTTTQIFLEQNYRSTGSILSASLAIVAQDKSRVPKNLYTSHPTGPLPVLCSFQSEHAEAEFIALEIKRVVAHMGGVLSWEDFVVLLRFNALSRAIESALQKEGIPSRVLGGHKFFERLEIKDMLAYLQIVDNPLFVPAFVRAVNVPSRGIGEKTLGEIMARADKLKLSPLEIVERIHDSKIPDTKPSVKRRISSFVNAVRTLRDLAAQGTSPADLLRQLLRLTAYEDHLRKTQPDWETRWENIQELINFATEAEVNLERLNMAGEMRLDGSIENNNTNDTPLRLFLQASMLSSDSDNQDNAGAREKVTISTCHAAKGLEWPVVMIPAVEKGTFPFYRADDVEEERRLLYVACTRAQGLLYLSHSTKRKVAGDSKTKEVSDFISSVVKQPQVIFSNSLPEFSATSRSLIAGLLNRPEPKELEVTRRIAEFNRTWSHYKPLNTGDTPWQQSGHMHMTSPASFQNANAVSAKFNQSLEPLPVMHPLPRARTMDINVASKQGLAFWQKTPVKFESTKPRTMSLSATENTFPLLEPPNAQTSTPETASNIRGGRRRLGMGQLTVGYPNKRFKAPAQTAADRRTP